VAEFRKFSALIVQFVLKLQLFLSTRSMRVFFHILHLPHSATCNFVYFPRMNFQLDIIIATCS